MQFRRVLFPSRRGPDMRFSSTEARISRRWRAISWRWSVIENRSSLSRSDGEVAARRADGGSLALPLPPLPIASRQGGSFWSINMHRLGHQIPIQPLGPAFAAEARFLDPAEGRVECRDDEAVHTDHTAFEIGRASCRERVCKYV